MTSKLRFASLLFHLVCIGYSFSWSQRIHSAIFELALETLPDHIKEDLTARSYYFADIDLAQNPSAMAALPDVLRHGLNLHLLDDYHYSVLFYKDILDNTLRHNERNHLYKILQTLTRHLTKYSPMRSDFFDTFSIVFATHLIVEIFQPLHTILEDGLRVHVTKSNNLHTYWDNGCMHFKKTKIPGIVQRLKEILESGSITLKNKEIDINFGNPFTSYRAIYLIKRLRDKYAEVDNRYDNGNQIVHDLIVDDEFIHSDDYKKFCMQVTIPNLINAAEVLRLFFIDVYKNLETKLKKKEESYYDINNVARMKRNEIKKETTIRHGLNKGFLVVILLQSVIILFMFRRRRK
eukprot:GAHX01000310.1.p1 GENE.GAHX01000310.1~~GAHX01000310.1.p1  ORF type:complete len:349 (+),score=45.13 GAHX01000310.1:44-1090(+)